MSSDERTPEEIERDIQRTRHELAETLGELNQRIEPKALVDQAVRFAESHVDAAEIKRFVLQHPLPIAMTGAGLGMLLASLIREEPLKRLPPPVPLANVEGDTLMNEQPYRTGTTPSSRSPDADSYSAGSGNRYTQALHDGSADVRARFNQMVNEQPLAISFIGLGVGLALGLMLPSTRQEDRLMGTTRDQLRDQAMAAGRAQLDRARDEVQRAAEDVQQRIRNA